MAIQNRRGNKADLNFSKLKIGELAVVSDLGEIWAKLTASVTKRLATLNANGKLDQMPTAADVGAATINGFATQAWYDVPGLDTSSLKFIGLRGLDENQIYQVCITGCFNPAGSPSYRATLCGKLAFPVGYANGVVTVKALFFQELAMNGTEFSGDGNFYAVLEGGGATLPYNTWAANKVAYIRWGRDPSSAISNWHISIKKLLDI